MAAHNCKQTASKKIFITFFTLFQLNIVSNMLLCLHGNQKMNTMIAFILNQDCKCHNRKKLEKKKERQRRSLWHVKSRTDQWIQNMLSDDCDDNDWRENFRMSCQNFYEFLEDLRKVVHEVCNAI